MTTTATPKRQPPTPEQIREQQKADAERDTAAAKAALSSNGANVPATVPPKPATAVALQSDMAHA